MSTQEQKIQKIKKDVKDKFINFIDRRKHPADQNLRLLALIPVIALIIGLFQPLIGVNASLSMANYNKSTEKTSLLSPEESVIEVSSSDFIFHQPLRDFEIWGLRIGEISILGVNVYDTIMTPLPSFDKLTQASDFINSGALNFLTSPDFVNFCNQYLGDFGQGVVAFANAIANIADKAGDVLVEITNALQRINAASVQIRSTITQIESILMTIDNFIVVFWLLVLLMIVLFLICIRPRFLPAIFLSIFSFIFVAIGIGVLVGNSIIANAIASSLNELSTTLMTALNNFLPGTSDILNGLGLQNIKLIPEITIFCGAGWWLITLSLLSLTALAYIVPVFKKRRLIKEGKIAPKLPAKTASTESEVAEPTTTKEADDKQPKEPKSKTSKASKTTQKTATTKASTKTTTTKKATTKKPGTKESKDTTDDKKKTTKKSTKK